MPRMQITITYDVLLNDPSDELPDINSIVENEVYELFESGNHFADNIRWTHTQLPLTDIDKLMRAKLKQLQEKGDPATTETRLNFVKLEAILESTNDICDNGE